MKKLLLFISISFLFFSNVYADTCSDYTIILEPPNINLKVSGSGGWYTMTLSNDGTNFYYITGLVTNTSYTLFPVDSNGDPTTLFSTRTNMVSMSNGPGLYRSSGKQYYTWSPNSSSGYFMFSNISGLGENFIVIDKAYFESVTWVLVPGSSTCSLPPPTPPGPPSNATYDSFLDVFLDRFEFLAINFTSNPYLFAFIGIIFAWIILELFLRIFHIRGGYKK